MFVRSVGVIVGGGVFIGDIPNVVVVIVLAVRPADGIQAVELIVGKDGRLAAGGIRDLADVAVVLVKTRNVQARGRKCRGRPIPLETLLNF
jgi:hypothetical protein